MGMAVILCILTLPIPLSVAYDKTRKDKITAATPEAKKIAESGYYYRNAIIAWVSIWIILGIVVSAII